MNEKSETFKKSYPDTFVRYFFRFVKSIQGKRGGAITFAKAKKRLHRIPPAFIIPSGKTRGTYN